MRRALVIATESYDDPRFPPLLGAEADANQLDEVLGSAAIGAFDVTVLRNDELRRVAIEVEQFFRHATADDTLLLHISGHGELDEQGRLYFVAKDTDADLLFATALSARDVNQQIRASAARGVIVLLDCCYSGAFNRGDGSRARTTEFEVLEGRGRVVMTAASASQRSYGEDEGGQFTRAVVAGLRTGDADTNQDGFVDAAELFDYVRRHVKDKRQTPAFFADVVYGPLYIARNAHGPNPDATFPPLRRRNIFAFTRPRKFVREVLARPMPRRLVAGLLVGSGLLAGCGTRADGVVDTSCPAATQLRIGADPADQAAYGAVTEDFEDFVADRSGGCRSVHVHLFPLAAAKLSNGVHPDVWLPDASRDAHALGGAVERVVPVARTPIVLGVSTARDDANDSLRAAALSWPQLFAVASQPAGTLLPGRDVAQGWGVIRGDPTLSSTAQMVTAKLYVDKSASQAHDDVERWIEQRLDADRYPLADEPSLLCHQLAVHRASPAARTPAIILTEQQLVRFNLGYSDGSCVPGGVPADADHLTAFYPARTPVVSKVAVQLRWPAGLQSAGTHAYAEWFVNWLGTGPGRAALHRQGLRTSSIDTEPIVPANGALPGWPFGTLTDNETTPAVAARTAALYERARRPARFLVALDASGSMNTVTDDPTVTRYELAVTALQQAAQRIGGRDELGVVTFSGPGDTAPRPVLGFTRPAEDLSARVGRLASGRRPAGDTPLYAAVIQGAARLRAGAAAGDLRALVVLTDGRNTGSPALPTAAQTAGVRVFVIAVGDVTCGDSALRKIVTDSSGACYDAGSAALADVFGGMFRAVWNN